MSTNWISQKGLSIELPTSATTSSTTSVITIGAPTSGTLKTWDLYVKETSATVWDEVAIGLSGTSQTIGDLNPLTQYNYKAIGHVLVPQSTNIFGSFTTKEQSTRIIQRTSIYPAAVTNGMFQDMEPFESISAGNITSAGRTILSNYNNLTAPAIASGRVAYGIRFLLGNMSLANISGAKMIVGLSVGWNGNWTPQIDGVEKNEITGNLMTGWQNATINGNSLLPIPAASPRDSGMPLQCAWTDWMKIPQGKQLGESSWDFLTRFWLPARNAAPYALTHANWTYDVDNYFNNSVLAGRSHYRTMLWIAGGQNGPIEYYLRAEGDYVTNPATAGNIVSVAGQCPPSGLDFVERSYGYPGITHTPILAVEYALDSSEVA